MPRDTSSRVFPGLRRPVVAGGVIAYPDQSLEAGSGTWLRSEEVKSREGSGDPGLAPPTRCPRSLFSSLQPCRQQAAFIVSRCGSRVGLTLIALPRAHIVLVASSNVFRLALACVAGEGNTTVQVGLFVIARTPQPAALSSSTRSRCFDFPLVGLAGHRPQSLHPRLRFARLHRRYNPPCSANCDSLNRALLPRYQFTDARVRIDEVSGVAIHSLAKVPSRRNGGGRNKLRGKILVSVNLRLTFVKGHRRSGADGTFQD